MTRLYTVMFFGSGREKDRRVTIGKGKCGARSCGNGKRRGVGKGKPR